jgi:acyl-CoA synthetase (AMP-forming)/AMP-acid ligase II
MTPSSTPSKTPALIPGEAASVEHNAGGWISRWAAERPDSLAWVDGHRRCNYACAEDRVRRLTAWLATKGVGRGDRVALWLGNRGAMLEALFAAARLGAIVLPVNARLTPKEVAFQFDDSTPRVLLVERTWRERADAAVRIQEGRPPQVLEVGSAKTSGGNDSGNDDYEAALTSSAPSDFCEAVKPDDPMILMYTSGTTGKPKGALLPHRKTLYNSRNALHYFGITRTDRVLVVAPLFHSLGLQILAIPALYVGASVVLQEGFDAARVWSTIESEGVTYYGGVPTMHLRLLESLDRGTPLSAPPASLRFAFTAGAAATPELILAFHEHGLLVTQGYGQTETSILTCLEADRALSKAGSVGHPVRHAELRLIDPETIEGDLESWRDVSPGAIGEIVVRGPITMLGYWRRPEATAETLRGEWLRTGDLATRDEDFDITLVGRAREMYISGGENVYPAEVEATLAQHPDIEEVAVLAVSDPEWGEVGRAHVVPVTSRTIDPDTLSSWLKTRLARFKQPREFVIESALPRTASGKIQKHLLKNNSKTTTTPEPRKS